MCIQHFLLQLIKLFKIYLLYKISIKSYELRNIKKIIDKIEMNISYIVCLCKLSQHTKLGNKKECGNKINFTYSNFELISYLKINSKCITDMNIIVKAKTINNLRSKHIGR